ncbi:MAG: hypothetical protein SPJ55_07575, partial [Treponema sp.]|nr:hypothetical protein [Treponema sp.]
CARRFLGYRNYYNAALAAAPKKVFLPCVSLPRANFYENIFYNAFALGMCSFFICVWGGGAGEVCPCFTAENWGQTLFKHCAGIEKGTDLV